MALLDQAMLLCIELEVHVQYRALDNFFTCTVKIPLICPVIYRIYPVNDSVTHCNTRGDFHVDTEQN